jgi:hypothetical protein
MIQDAVLANSKSVLQQRAAAGRLAWAGPLGMVLARTVLAILAQGLVTLVYVWQRHPEPGRAATAWWSVSGTAIDLACLALLFWLARREGIRLLDLVGCSARSCCATCCSGWACW